MEGKGEEKENEAQRRFGGRIEPQLLDCEMRPVCGSRMRKMGS